MSACYVPKSGKTGEDMKSNFLEEVTGVTVLPCHHASHSCIKVTHSSEYIITKDDVMICDRKCDNCTLFESIWNDCKRQGNISYRSSLRVCKSKMFKS